MSVFGNTVGTPAPRPDWNQSDPKQADFILNKPTKLSEFENDEEFLKDSEVPSWARQTEKPTYRADEVNADPAGTSEAKTAEHNTDTEAHGDLRLEVAQIKQELAAFLDIDNETLDQLSELIAAIVDNKTDIAKLTSDKVNKTDIVDNLTTNATDKALSSAQGVVIAAAIEALRSGKLDASALASAINTALAQAKASGEFNGEDGTSVTVKNVNESTADGGSNIVTFSDGKTVTIKNGSKGGTGDAGVSISSVKQTTASTADGGSNVVTMTLSDGTTSAFTVKNGSKGSTGKTAYQYAQDGGYTGTETEFAEKLAGEYTLNPLYGKKVSFLGDSICAGSSDTHLGGYGKIIADRNGMVYENVARGGATVTAETYSRSTGNAKPWLCRMVENMSADADYAIIEGGINDGWDETVREKIGKITTGYNATLDDTTYYGAFESMLKQLVTKFQGKKIGYIAVPKIHSLYDSNQNAPNFYHIALECCAKWGVSVCDLNTITPPVEYLSDLGTTYTADGTHPTYEGYIKYYCDPVEAWMRTLTTGASVSVGTQTQNLDDKYLRKTDITTKKAQLKLEDGSTVLIDVVVASTGTTIQTYLNLVPTSIDTDKSVYNATGWKGKTRLSASSGSVKEGNDFASITGFIPVKSGDIVRFKFSATTTCWDVTNMNPGWNIMAYYNSSFTWLGSCCPTQSATSFYGICAQADNVANGSVANGGVVSFTVPSNGTIEYLRLSFSDPKEEGLSNLIVTVNEEIA